MKDKTPLHCPPREHEDDTTSIARSMTRMRLLIGRRFIGRLAIRKMGAGLELSHIDVIGIIRRLSQKQEVTIGAIAEQMHIDPSRGSRVVADLVRRGVLQRQASQEDARRTIVTLTPDGYRLLAQMEEVKMEAVASILADWPEQDMADFARLYERFVASFEERYRQFEAEIGAEPGEITGDHG
ncbi:MarR family transcriptional regulator [Rhizobium sp. RU36D]|uniref:MarR family winged helix-turn-helix transcriptional regulator n=1 Tax=Rhizobium sp. RU36D TaxID=1907415 RepID=UPI0009D842A2|nr:MarR family transcriptional regulator [Rhizobium sp. RU36D]SMC96513.1 transcriptional regulator, MarR family [Rhizobium sp. RU36D]